MHILQRRHTNGSKLIRDAHHHRPSGNCRSEPRAQPQDHWLAETRDGGATGRLDSYISLVGEVQRLWENSLAVPQLLNRVITRPAIPLQPKRHENVPRRNAMSGAAFCVTAGTTRTCRGDKHTVTRPYRGNYAATRGARR